MTLGCCQHVPVLIGGEVAVAVGWSGGPLAGPVPGPGSLHTEALSARHELGALQRGTPWLCDVLVWSGGAGHVHLQQCCALVGFMQVCA